MADLHAPTAATDGVLRPTHLRVDLDRIAANYHALVAHAGGRMVMPILKANAYGHGLVPVARRLEAEGAPYLGVAYVEEGILLRRAGVRAPVLVLGGILGDQVPLFIEHDLTLTASSVDKLRAIDAAAAAMGRRARVHLKVDTGMERIGVHWYSAAALGEAALASEHVDIEGAYSHLARSDESGETFTAEQLARFQRVLAEWEEQGLRPRIRHLANSGGLLQHPETWLDMVRPGIALYGVPPGPGCALPPDVRPALRWLSRVVYFKVVQPGSPVSYGSTWVPEQMTRIVTVPVGYGDGYFRAMSGRAEVVLGGRRYPVVGRICMDQLMVDIGWDSAFNGDEVVLLGEQGGASVGAGDLAAWAGTIPYEVLTNINTRVPRVYVGAVPD
ncbi:MAG: alanine racemase [Myxococcota bacterium]|nr:alanine racemase [Myxococcota bacterium]